MSAKPDLAALQKALDQAVEAKRVADHNASFARSRATDALNELNTAQKAFDAGVAAIRADGAKAGGDWSTPKGSAFLDPPPPPPAEDSNWS